MKSKSAYLRIAIPITLALSFVGLSVLAQSVVNTVIFSPPSLPDNVGFPQEMAVVESTGLVYVGSSNATGSEVGVIVPGPDLLTQVISLPTPGGVDFSRVDQTSRIVYFRQLPSNIAVIDGRPSSATFNQALQTISIPGETVQSFALDETRGLLFVTTTIGGGPSVQSRVHVINADPTSPAFEQTVYSVTFPTGVLARGIATNPTTNKAYVGAQGGPLGGVYLLNNTAMSLTKIAGTVGSFGVVVNEQAGLVYATAQGNQLMAVDGLTDSFLASIPMPGLIVPQGFAFGLNTVDEMLAVNQATGRVYVQTSENATPGKVVVVDGDRLSPTFNTVLAAVSVGRAGAAVIVDESLNRILSASFFDHRTDIIDGATNAVIGSIPTNNHPSDITLNRLTHRAYVAVRLTTVQEVDVGTASLEATTLTMVNVGFGVLNPNTNLFFTAIIAEANSTPVFDKCGQVGVVGNLPHTKGNTLFMGRNATTNRIYAVNEGASLNGLATAPGYVSVIDGNTNSVIANVVAGNRPFGIGINEVTDKIYIGNFGIAPPQFPGSVTVIDGATNIATAADTSAFPPNTQFGIDLIVNDATNKVYVRTGLNGLGVLDGNTNVATPLTISPGPVTMIRVNRALNRVYVASMPAGLLHVLDGATDTQITTLPIGTTSRNGIEFLMAVNEKTGLVYVANFDDDTLTVIDGNSDTIIATLPVGDGPAAVVVNELTNRVYVSNVGDRTITFIDGETMTVEQTLPIGIKPRHLTVDRATSRIYAETDLLDERSGAVIVSDAEGTFDSLRQAITAATAGDPAGLRNSMLSKVNNARQDFSQGDYKAMSNKLNSLEQEVEAQRGGRLTNAEADLIVALISAIRNSVC